MSDAQVSNPQIKSEELKLLSSSALFDKAFYLSQNKVDLQPDETPEQHYLLRGERLGFRPSPHFEPSFYASVYPDVVAANVNLLFHFIRYGTKESRHPTRASLQHDARLVLKAGLFDQHYYEQHHGSSTHASLKPVEQYLLSWRKGHRANETFDDIFYFQFYPDVGKSRIPPILHYIKQGRDEARIRNKAELTVMKSAMADDFDAKHYAAQLDGAHPGLNDPDKLLEHYLSTGAFGGLTPTATFSGEYYLRRNADILKAAVDPYHHFLKYGRREGRPGLCPTKTMISTGRADFDPDKETILIANHEASRTGAPLLGLELVKHFARTHNVITALGRTGEIADEFAELSCKLLIGRHHAADTEFALRDLVQSDRLSAVLTNSIEAGAYVHAAAANGLPVVALVHEFAEYTLPMGRMTQVAQAADRVVFPSRLVEASAQSEITGLCGAPAPNVAIIPQGVLAKEPPFESKGLSEADIRDFLKERCPGRDKVVLGAGFIGMRKGVDLFIETAAQLNKVRKDVCFVWVGDGYHPKNDLNYSVWLQEMVKRMGLQDCVQFLPAQPDLKACMAVADVFYLSSRLDPFPNVFVDAVSEGLPVVCFEGATGVAEFVSETHFRGEVAPHCDVVAASAAVGRIVDAAEPKRIAEQALRMFDFAAYVEAIAEELRKAAAARARVNDQVAEILAANLLDPGFYHGHALGRLRADNTVIEYVGSASKDLTLVNPRAGFSENLYRRNHAVEAGVSALAHALRANPRRRAGDAPPRTHACLNLGNEGKRKAAGRALLHVHLHYSGILPEIIERLKVTKSNIDLLVTVTSVRLRKEAEFNLLDLRKRADVAVVENRGRDLGPFLTHVLPALSSGAYDYVGHIHGKKSVDVAGSMGDDWRKFLFDTLLGDGRPLADEILSILDEEQDLGMLFAEDRYNVGWGINFDFAQRFVDRLSVPVALPQRPVFPIGSMFWAKAKALEPMLTASWTAAGVPTEPLPYDGSGVHALERILPSVCETAGFRWATVQNPHVSR